MVRNLLAVLLPLVVSGLVAQPCNLRASVRKQTAVFTLFPHRPLSMERVCGSSSPPAKRAGSNERSQRPLRVPTIQAAESSKGGLRILEWIPSQQLLVTGARAGAATWNKLWLTMLSELAPQSAEGAYVRPAPQTGSGTVRWPADLPPVAGRYHVYVGNACPWCHRVLIALKLRGLLGKVSFTRLIDDPEKASRGGWAFAPTAPDPLCNAPDLRGVYNRCTPGGTYTGRCTAPLLVDLATSRIISNESGDIVRMLNDLDIMTADLNSDKAVDLYPEHLRDEIDRTNAWVYELINNGVYRAGFCSSQSAYEAAERDVHIGLARADAALGGARFLAGDTVTEADVRMLPTAVRFDGVYASLFRCGRRLIRSDYQNVQRWMRDMLELTGDGLFDLQEARHSYYRNLFPLNPGGIVPAGPNPEDLGMPKGGGVTGEQAEGAFSWKGRQLTL